MRLHNLAQMCKLPQLRQIQKNDMYVWFLHGEVLRKH